MPKRLLFSDLETSFPELRREYRFGYLLEKNLFLDPLKQFADWFQEAVRAKIPAPHAMTLATASGSGKPDARIMLLKGFDSRGFLFYSNAQSQKGMEIRCNPRGALVFFWPSIERQVRIRGPIVQIPTRESDAYFRLRPRSAQLGAFASHQSKTIPSRKMLEKKIRLLETKFSGCEIPRPRSWSGFRLIPQEVEFWQGRENRLNDRIRYRRFKGNRWKIERLQP